MVTTYDTALSVIDVGRAAGGGRFTVPAPGHGLCHILLSGKTGSGKSSTAAKLVGTMSAMPNVAFVGIDHKGGLELFPWEPRFTEVAATHEQGIDLLARVNALVDRRAVQIRRRSCEEGRTLREWRDDMGPRLVVVADEIAQCHKPELVLLDSIAARGRALGINLLCSTQYGLAKTFPSEFLLNMTSRICHRMGTGLQYATALAVSTLELLEAGWETIDEDDPGICYVAGIPGMDDFTRCRSDYVSDEAIDRRANATAHYRWTAEAVFGD